MNPLNSQPDSQPDNQLKNEPGPSDYADLSNRQHAILLASILIVALCGIAYELIIGTISSYLLGNSVYQFSLTIGFFMFAMGVGSYLSKLLDDQLIRNFISVEIAISLVGGICSLLLFMAFPFVRALYDTVMYSLILIIGALVGMEIPILTTILSKKHSTRDSIANVMSLDYIGALIGAVSFPLLLLPQLGLVRSSFAIGLVNILTALVNIYFFRHQLKSPRLLGGIALLIFVMLVSFTVAGTRLTSFAEKHLYFDQVIYTKQTAYQRERAREIRKNTQRQVVEGLQLSWRAHDAIEAQIQYLEIHVKASLSTKLAYQKQFYIGRRTLLDLLNTENESVDARRTLINAAYDRLFSYYRIFNSTGQLLSEFEAD